MPKSFKGPRTPLTRSQYGKTARKAKDQKLNKLRGMERGNTGAKTGFDAVVAMAKPLPRGKKK